VAFAVCPVQAQGAEAFWKNVAGMIAEQQERGSPRFIVDADRLRVPGPQKGFR
jgi:hypothetical protein